MTKIEDHKTKICIKCKDPVDETEIYKIVFSQGTRPADWNEKRICHRCVNEMLGGINEVV